MREEEARRGEQVPRQLPKEAVEPVKVKVHKTEGAGMEIDWKDGHHSSWTFRWLRDGCPCATCNEEREKDGPKPGEPKVTPVGRYAVGFSWNDGRTCGMYSWCNCGGLAFPGFAEVEGGRVARHRPGVQTGEVLYP